MHSAGAQSFNMTDKKVPRTGQILNRSGEVRKDEVLEFNQGATTFDIDATPRDGVFVHIASDSDEDGSDLKKNPFLDPDVAAHWATVYDQAQYECRGYFDPTLTWTEEEEKKIIRRLDWRVCLWAVSQSNKKQDRIL